MQRDRFPKFLAVIGVIGCLSGPLVAKADGWGLIGALIAFAVTAVMMIVFLNPSDPIVYPSDVKETAPAAPEILTIDMPPLVEATFAMTAEDDDTAVTNPNLSLLPEINKPTHTGALVMITWDGDHAPPDNSRRSAQT